MQAPKLLKVAPSFRSSVMGASSGVLRRLQYVAFAGFSCSVMRPEPGYLRDLLRRRRCVAAPVRVHQGIGAREF
jgi:hypothetical protein